MMAICRSKHHWCHSSRPQTTVQLPHHHVAGGKQHKMIQDYNERWTEGEREREAVCVCVCVCVCVGWEGCVCVCVSMSERETETETVDHIQSVRWYVDSYLWSVWEGRTLIHIGPPWSTTSFLYDRFESSQSPTTHFERTDCPPGSVSSLVSVFSLSLRLWLRFDCSLFHHSATSHCWKKMKEILSKWDLFIEGCQSFSFSILLHWACSSTVPRAVNL